ncbi:hypothetical protein, partial [Rhodococcus qingshengii]|uniref:hypothetical protein n=1 Tax=Rhodococcus qingshengii TaxID=334542 RepID=UPI001BE0C962
RIFDTLQIIFREGTPSRDPQVLIISPGGVCARDSVLSVLSDCSCGGIVDAVMAAKGFSR